VVQLLLTSGVQRYGDARGDCLIVCLLTNFSIEQWRVVVIVTGHTLFVTSQYDVVLMFAKLTFWRCLLTQSAYYFTRTLLIRQVVVQCSPHNEHKLSALHEAGAKHGTLR